MSSSADSKINSELKCKPELNPVTRDLIQNLFEAPDKFVVHDAKRDKIVEANQGSEQAPLVPVFVNFQQFAYVTVSEFFKLFELKDPRKADMLKSKF